MKVRRLLVTLHVWLGISIGALWALQGLTGAVLVFNRDIQPFFLTGESDSGAFLPLDEIFVRAGEAARSRISYVATFGPKPSLLLAYYKDGQERQQTLVVDARSGAVLDYRDPEILVPTGGSSWRWLLRLHKSLLAGDVGHIFIGTSGLLLVSTLLMGIFIAWPRNGAWRLAFGAGRWRTTTQRLFGWHRMVGLSAGAALLVMVPCGIYLAFSDALMPWLVENAGYQPPFAPTAVKALPEQRITAERALAIALNRFPDAGMVSASPPTAKSPVYMFRLRQSEEVRRWAGTTAVAVDPASGHVLNVYDPLTAPTANRLGDFVYATHTGEIAGPLGRLIVMIFGLAIPVLYVTGMMAWLRRSRRRRKGKASFLPTPALSRRSTE